MTWRCMMLQTARAVYSKWTVCLTRVLTRWRCMMTRSHSFALSWMVRAARVCQGGGGSAQHGPLALAATFLCVSR